jgi:hypothetical protein
LVITFSGILLFPEKEAKSVVPLRGRSYCLGISSNSVRLDPRPLRSRPSGLAANRTIVMAVEQSVLAVFFFFQKKKQKALFRFAEGHMFSEIRLMAFVWIPKLGEADPGGLGACPQ